MKKQTIFFTTFLMLAVIAYVGLNYISCTKSHEKPLVTRTELNKLETRNEQVTAFQELTPEQQCNIWIDKLDEVLKQNLSSEQRLLVLEAKEKLSPKVYSSGNVEFQDYIRNSWFPRAVKTFTKEELKSYFAKIRNMGDEDKWKVPEKKRMK